MTWKRFWDWVFGKKAPPVVIPRPQKPPKPTRLPRCPIMDKVSRTEKEAKDRAKHMSLRAYRCEFCPHWHLTHTKDKMKFH